MCGYVNTIKWKPLVAMTWYLDWMCFCVFSLGLYFVYSFVFLWFVCVSPSYYVSLGSWVISLTVFDVSVTNLNEPPKALATSTIMWVRTQLHPFWAIVNKSNAGYYVAGPPLVNGRCTSLLRAPVSEMTYTVSSGTLNYYTIPYLDTWHSNSPWHCVEAYWFCDEKVDGQGKG